MSPLPDELRDRYQVRRELGRGGFGVVLAADDQQLGRRVAVKLLGSTQDEDFAARFQREAQVTASLRHPHVVAVYDYGVSREGVAYILYELVEGPSLAQEVAGRHPGPEAVVRWGVQLAEALQAAHDAGVVHRDVKPGNVLLREDGQAVLCDFGIAHRPMGRTVVTEEGIRLGTPAYMAPESLLEGATTPAADQFALGSTLLEALTGRPAYGTGELDGVLRALRTSEPLGAAALRRVPPGLAKVLARALDRDPARRYRDLGALARALEEADLRGAPSGRSPARLGPGPSGHTTTRKRLRPAPEAPSRRMVRRVGAGWAAILLGAGLVYGLLTGGASPEPSPTAPPTAQAVSEAEGQLADAEAELRRVLLELAGPHGVAGKPLGRWLPAEDPEHRRVVKELGYSADFVPRVRRLERAFLAWDRRAERASPTYALLTNQVLVDFLPHLAGDLQLLDHQGLQRVLGVDFEIPEGHHRVPRHVQALAELRGRLVTHLAEDPRSVDLSRLRDAVWLGARGGVDSPRLEELIQILARRLREEGGSPDEYRRATPALASGVRRLAERGHLSCEEAQKWTGVIGKHLRELPRGPKLDLALDALRAVIGLESAVVHECRGPDSYQALHELRGVLVEIEEQVDHVPGTAPMILAIGAELRGLFQRSLEVERDTGKAPGPGAGRTRRRLFWLSEKLVALGYAATHEVVPEPVRERAAWILERVPRAGTEAGPAEVLAAYRGLRVMRTMPWPLMEATAAIAAVTRFPARTYLAGRLRHRVLQTESDAERAPMQVALEGLTKHYLPRSAWGCAMLRGEMWGNVHSEQGLRQNVAPELSFFTTTDTLTPFLAGAGTNAALMLRDCPGQYRPEDERLALELLEDGVRGRGRGIRFAAKDICKFSEYPGPAWDAAAARDAPVVGVMAQLCR